MSSRLCLVGASVLALAIAVPALAQPAPTAVAAPSASLVAPPLDYRHRTLENGLNVYAMPDATAGTVTVTLWYDVGGKDDPEGRSGFAHLFEHILSRQTVNIPYGGIAAMVENAGGTRNASTGQDFTNYYETVPPEYLERVLWTHAERMARPVVDQAVFEAERNIVKEELRQRVYAPPYGRFQRFVIGDNAYDESIYRRSVIGSIEELDAATIDDARAFHEAYYRPATATLIVSGNFDPTQLDRWVDQYFGDIANPDRPVPVLERPVARARTQPRHVVAYAPNVPRPAIARLYPGVAADHPDNAALEIMAAVLSRGDSSRLHRALVYDRQLVSNAGLGIGSDEEAGTITTTATVAAGQSIEAAEAALDAELDRIRREPITAAELEEARTELLAADLRQRETASGRAFMLGQAIVSEGDPTAPDRRLRDLAAVTAADVQRVANAWLNDDARVTVRYLDDSQRPADVAEDSWRNPAPVPTFLTVPPAILPANALLPEGQRQAAPPLGQARAVAAPVIAERVLPNGLRVVVARSTDLPIVNMRLVMAGGAATDPAGLPGVADMTATLASLGAGGMSAPEIAQTLERLGAGIGGGAGADATSLTLSAPVASAPEAARVLAQVVTAPDFAPAEFERARTRAVNAREVAMREPGPVAALAVTRLAYGDAAYGSPAGGTPDSLRALTRDAIVDHHRTWWRPDNAALIVTGAMSADEGFALAEAALGDWQAPNGERPAIPARAGAAPSPRVVVVDLPNAGQAAVTAAVRGPRRSDDAFYPLTVANAVMGSGSTSRLFQEIRAKRGLSYGASSSLTSRVEDGLLVASTQTKNESAAEVVDLVLAEFDRLGAEPIEAARVADRQAFVNGGYSRSLETTAGLGGVLADAVIQGMPLDDTLGYLQRISATTPDQLGTAAASTVSADRAHVVVVGDSRLFLDALRARHPNLEVIPMAELDLLSPTLR